MAVLDSLAVMAAEEIGAHKQRMKGMKSFMIDNVLLVNLLTSVLGQGQSSTL
jgi:hypothetical protein